MLLGAIVSVGGGFLASTFGTWNADWTFSTPPILRAGAGWFGTLDLWSGALVGQHFDLYLGIQSLTLTRLLKLLYTAPQPVIQHSPHYLLIFP